MNQTGKRFTRRRQYFIKKPFQTKFMIGFTLLLVAQVLLIAAFFTLISSQTITTGYSGSRFVIDKTSSFFFVSLIIISLIVVIAVGLAGIVNFIRLSHRIAGPLYRFEKTLQNLSDGNLSHRVDLRRTDQLTDLRDAFNAALDKMDNQLKEIKKDLEEAHNLTQRYDKEEHVQEVKAAIDRAKEKTTFFKTS